jgi:hypothetical protein
VRRRGEDGHESDESEDASLAADRGDGGSSNSFNDVIDRAEAVGDAEVLRTEGELIEDPVLVESVVEGKADRRRRRVVQGVGVLLLLVLVISLSVGMTVQTGTAPGQPAPPPTLAPTYQPTIITAGTVETWLSSTKLSSSTITALNQTGTPQHRAFQWLTSAGRPPIPLHRMTQQFALATLFYATGGGSSAAGWRNQSGWLSDPDECKWHGCECTRTEQSWMILQRLELAEHNLTGPLPGEIGLLSSVEFLDLSKNELYGTIPSDLFELINILVLNIDNNKLNGTIPRQIGQLTKLSLLDIWNNRDLTGTLPTELGLLTDIKAMTLERVDTSGPRLSGPIPTEIGRLTKLTTLAMSGYRFTRRIPSEFGNLLLLESLNLALNELTGWIPTELGRMSKLDLLDVHWNSDLSGTIPSELCSLIQWSNLEVIISCDDPGLNCTCGCSCFTV